MKIGIIGIGIVGGALKRAFETSEEIHLICYDKFKSEYGWSDLILESEVIFVCAPSPTINGKQDLSALKDILSLLSSCKFKGAVVIKSTVLPGTTAALNEHYGNLRLAHNPEFLTESNAYEDLMFEKFIIMSGKSEVCSVVHRSYNKIFGDKPIMWNEKFEVTEMAKYMHNCFLAVKVTFCNEIYEICQLAKIDYGLVKEAAIGAGKIGRNHTRVPGPDGLFGYGGACFPKDMKAFSTWTKEIGVFAGLIESSIILNSNYRSWQIAESKTHSDDFDELGY